MSEELKPCPFCGEAQDLECTGASHFGWSVGCGNCGATGASVRPRDFAIEVWNRRAALAPLGSDDPPQGLRPAGSEGGLQARTAKWMLDCFGAEVAADIRERCDRFIEEALEKVQAHGYDPSRVATLVDYVYGREVGDPAQETGGVLLTLAALDSAAGIDMEASGLAEMGRVEQPAMIQKIRAKQATKRGLHTPLPTPPEPLAPPVVRVGEDHSSVGSRAEARPAFPDARTVIATPSDGER